MAEIKIPISVELANALPKLKQLTGELGKVEQEAEGVITGFEHISSGANKIGDQGVKSFKAQLREANQELLTMAQRFGATSPQAAAAAARVADLKDQIGDAKLLTDAFNPDAKFTAFANALKGVTGAFSAVQGAQALFGSESKAVEQALLKVQGAMALSQGLNSIMEAKDAFIALGVQLGIVRKAKLASNAAEVAGTTIQAANTAATEAGAIAEGQLAVATTGAAGAMNVLKTALIATGIGALVVALGLLVANFDTIKEKITGVNAGTQAFNDTVKDLQSGLAGAYEETSKVRNAFDLARKGVIDKKEALSIYNDTLGDSFGKTNDLNEAEKRFNEGAETYIKIVGLKAQANALYAKAAEAAAKGTTAGLEDQISTFDKVIAGAQIFFGNYSGGAVKASKAQEEGTKKATEKYQQQAKQINAIADALSTQAAELEKTSKIKVGGDPAKTEKTKKDVETVASVLKNLKEQIDGLNRVGLVMKTDTLPDQIKAVESTIIKLLTDKDLKLKVKPEQIEALKRQLQQLETKEYFLTFRPARILDTSPAALQKNKDEIEAWAAGLKPIELKVDPKARQAAFQPIYDTAAQQKFMERTKDLAAQTNQMLSAGFADAISGFAEGLGNAISGQGNLTDAFKSGLMAIGAMMQQIGKLFIQQAIAVELFKKTIFTNTAVAIVAGAALIAAGAAIKNATSKKFASGGFVSGPGTDKSDSIPAMLSNGEYVINAASVRKFGVGFFNNLNSGLLRFATGGLVAANQTMTPVISEPFGQMIPYIASTEVRGQDLRIVLNRANSRFNNSN